MVSGCAASARQRPVEGSPVASSGATLENARRVLEGKWTLVSLNVTGPDGRKAAVEATGTLVSGSTGTIGNVPGASATVTFSPTNAGFFSNPSAATFYANAETAFINAPGTVTPTATGFMIDNGGGSLHFTTPIPEPETYALMLVGLASLGWVARRRKQRR